MIIATAGHVDHGKTSLVKQLTGVDTDRLEEEKRRGLSINLGYAYQHPEPGVSLGFIDVPGHRRFINTMIAGISGIDLGMLVVAADDGPMPQTREHLAALELLGVDNYLLVVTKTDRVEAARVDEVRDHLLALLPSDTPSFAVSNTEGNGVDALRDALYEAARKQPDRQRAGHFRLSLDRSFNLKGSGLVVTGTALSGEVSVGDTLRLLPLDIPVKVRSLHAQDQEAKTGHAGQRLALNITGNVEQDQLARGDWLAADPEALATTRFDARVRLLDDAPFAPRHLSPVRVHIGAKRISARLFLLESGADNRRLDPGHNALAQLLCDEPLHACHGDRFLLRDDSESVTLGGGRILDPHPPKAGKQREARLQQLRAEEAAAPADTILQRTGELGQALPLKAFCRDHNLTPAEGEQLLNAAGIADLESVDSDDGPVLLGTALKDSISSTLLARIASYHEEHPADPGIGPAPLKNLLKREVEDALFLPLLKDMLVAGKLGLTDGMLHLPERAPSLAGSDQSAWSAVKAAMEERDYRLPLVSDLATETGLDARTLANVLQQAVKARLVLRLNPQRYALAASLKMPAAVATELADSDEGLTVIRFKDALGCGRKLAIEILEYFDRVHFTQRRDPVRVILDASKPAQLFGEQETT